MSSLEGKVALVTGGSSGIGLATAKEFHDHGANVVITGRDQERLKEVARQLGNNVLAIPTKLRRLRSSSPLTTPHLL